MHDIFSSPPNKLLLFPHPLQWTIISRKPGGLRSEINIPNQFSPGIGRSISDVMYLGIIIIIVSSISQG